MATNPVQVEKFLSGMDYPASKQDVVNYARGKGADENTLNTLQKMPGTSFDSPVDISEAIGQIE